MDVIALIGRVWKPTRKLFLQTIKTFRIQDKN